MFALLSRAAGGAECGKIKTKGRHLCEAVLPAGKGAGLYNDDLANGVQGVLDMHFASYIFGHGDLPF